jgi:hypothetical protein
MGKYKALKFLIVFTNAIYIDSGLVSTNVILKDRFLHIFCSSLMILCKPRKLIKKKVLFHVLLNVLGISVQVYLFDYVYKRTLERKCINLKSIE